MPKILKALSAFLFHWAVRLVTCAMGIVLVFMVLKQAALMADRPYGAIEIGALISMTVIGISLTLAGMMTHGPTMGQLLKE